MHFRKAWLKKRRSNVGAADKSYFDHKEGIFTNYYPHESLPIPDNGRNRLHNEIDDCIVCDKCAKVCPVDCIEIEAIKDPVGEIRKTSDGSSVRLHPAKFNIDMAQCCFCGLCTTVCPTECLTMTKTFDYSEVDIRDMVYEFSYLSESEVEVKKKELEEHVAAMQQKQAVDAKSEVPTNEVKTVIKPKVVIPGAKATAPKPVIPGAVAKPKVVIPKPVIKKAEEGTKPAALMPKIGGVSKNEDEPKSALKPVIPSVNKPAALKPKMVIKPKSTSDSEEKPKPSALKPVMKPKMPPKPDSD